MAIDYVKIPQEIRIEDKIIGPFSLRQLGLIGVGGGISYALFASMKKSLGFVPITAHFFIWFPLLICAAYALVKYNNLSLFRITLLLVESQTKPKARIWVPRRGISILETVTESKLKIGGFFGGKKGESEKENGGANNRKETSITDLAGIIDSDGAPEANGSAVLSISPVPSPPPTS